jgi:hypothetical protein
MTTAAKSTRKYFLKSERRGGCAARLITRAGQARPEGVDPSFDHLVVPAR